MKTNKKDVNYQWVCADCTVDSDTDDDTGNTADIRNAIMKRLDAIEAKQAELERSQEFLSSQHDSFGVAMLKCNDFTKQLRTDLVSVSKNCSVMKDEVDDVKSRQITEIQKKVVNTALIRGAKEEDDPSSVVQKIANVIQMDNITEKVESATIRKNVNKESVIFVKFSDSEAARDFVRESKRRKISTHCIGYTDDRKPIYVDEQLTRDTFLLFKYAKKLKKIGCMFVWISGGDIMARKNSKSPFIRIKSKSHVDSIEKDLLLNARSDTQ